MLRNIVVVLGITAAIAAAFALAACGGSDPPVEQRATTLLGGPLSNFGGVDGSDPAVRAVARDIATSRTYDFTPAGFVVASGAASSEGLMGSGYGDGTGTITVAAGDGQRGEHHDKRDLRVRPGAAGGQHSGLELHRQLDIQL